LIKASANSIGGNNSRTRGHPDFMIPATDKAPFNGLPARLGLKNPTRTGHFTCELAAGGYWLLNGSLLLLHWFRRKTVRHRHEHPYFMIQY
jgi:hypothetical protein